LLKSVIIKAIRSIDTVAVIFLSKSIAQAREAQYVVVALMPRALHIAILVHFE